MLWITFLIKLFFNKDNFFRHFEYNNYLYFYFNQGLRFCVLKKDASSNKRRPAEAAPFVPTVRPSGFENLRVPLSSLQEDLSDNTFPSLLPLIRDGKIEEAKQFIEQGADVNEEDIHG